jgi:predicted nucleic acid-binding protein
VTDTGWIAPGSLIYLDANVIVYFIEQRDALQAKVAEVLVAAVAVGCRFAVNEAGVAECFFGIFKTGSVELEQAYRAFFAEKALIDIREVNGPLLLRAARMGAEAGLKLIDATHVVSAIEAGATHLLTNDRAMVAWEGVGVVQLGEL